MKPDLSIVVVTYRCAPELEACLRSLERLGILADESTEVLVVDNASGDETPDVANRFQPGVTVLRRTSNDGFAAGCNAGASMVNGRKLLFLNPDTIIDGDGLTELCAHLDANPEVGVVGPRILDDGGDDGPSARSFPTPGTEFARMWSRIAGPLGFEYSEPRIAEEGGPTDWISGACFMVRREAWAAVGEFDTGFFLYYEETDWCRRAWENGWEVHHCPSAEVVHVGGASAARSGEAVREGVVARHYRDSRRRYFKKHHGATASLFVEGLVVTREAFELLKRRAS